MQERMSGARRNLRQAWKRDRGICQYCGFPADCIDHVLPYSWRPDNSLDNLVAACARCNGYAGSLIFPSFELKRDYILSKRRPEIIKELDTIEAIEAYDKELRESNGDFT